MVAHDPTLERVACDSRTVADLSERELRTVDLGGGARVPSLGEVLAFCHERELALNVELKRDVPDRLAAVRATVACLRRGPAPRALVLSSFDPAMLVAVRTLAPTVPLALLIGRDRRSRRLAPLAPLLAAAALHVDAGLLSVIEAALRGRRRVAAWTVNDPELARLLLARGVDGLISDVPARMRRELAGWLDRRA
jgi:glycerophosphoryl diester phosphodiesterase